MRAIRTEKKPHLIFKQITETVQPAKPIKRLSVAASARLLTRLGLKPKASAKPLFDADGNCAECHMFGHDASVHVKLYSSTEIIAPAGVPEEMRRFKEHDYDKEQYRGRYQLPLRGHNRGALRQKGKLTTGIDL